MSFEVSAAVHAKASVSAQTTLTPGDQDRGWENRWEDIERGLENLLKPQTGPCAADSIQAAEQELTWFYGLAYHLKDLLIPEIPRQTIESTITNTPDLALLCDLAHLTKHGHLRQIRSGVAPEIVSREGSSCEGGWRLIVTIQHGADTHDGLDVARAAVAAWRQTLTRWALI